MRATEHATRGSCRVLKRFHALADISGRGAVGYGAPRVGRLLPDEGAVLKTADFPDVSALAATLRRLAAGPEPTEHFRWRARADRAPAFQRVLDMSAHKYTALCRVCERLQADKARS